MAGTRESGIPGYESSERNTIISHILNRDFPPVWGSLIWFSTSTRDDERGGGPRFLNRHGYSEEMKRLMDLVVTWISPVGRNDKMRIHCDPL